MNIRHDFPIWAPRLSKGMIKKLYKNDAAGINDEELVDMVGYMLYNRCRSFLIAVEAFHGQASCPLCEVKIRHNREKNFILICKNCNWELSWGDYFSTIQHKQLSGAKPVLELFSQFTEKFPTRNISRKNVPYRSAYPWFPLFLSRIPGVLELE